MEDKTKTLEQVLWDSATAMRGTMGAASYMDYSLGLIFYKYLSDTLLETVVSTLVENGELRLGHDRSRKEQLPRHAAAVASYLVAEPVTESAYAARTLNVAVDVVDVRREKPCHKTQVRLAGHVLVRACLVGEVGYVLTDFFRLFYHAVSRNYRVSGGRREKSRYHADSGRLSGSVRSDEREYLAFFDIERDLVGSKYLGVLLGKLFDFEYLFHKFFSNHNNVN